jgi:small GTP-binding protein
MGDDFPQPCKIVIVGDCGCGKTSLIYRWVSDAFVANIKPTIGSNHQRKRMRLNDGSEIELFIWDTAGAEAYRALMPLYVRSAKVVVVTAALDSPASFDSIPTWINPIKESSGPLPPCVLAANKADLDHDVSMMKQQIFERFDATFQSRIFFCSARTGENCGDLFSCIAETAAASIYQEPGARELTETGLKRCC